MSYSIYWVEELFMQLSTPKTQSSSAKSDLDTCGFNSQKAIFFIKDKLPAGVITHRSINLVFEDAEASRHDKVVVSEAPLPPLQI
jgi:hypothetical protein